MTKPKVARAKSNVPSNTNAAQLLNHFGTILPLLATGLITCAATLFLVSALGGASTNQPPFAVFDVDAAMARFVALPEVASLASDDQRFSATVRDFHTALQTEMARFAEGQNVALLSANAVLAGQAPDVTAALVERVLNTTAFGVEADK